MSSLPTSELHPSKVSLRSSQSSIKMAEISSSDLLPGTSDDSDPLQRPSPVHEVSGSSPRRVSSTPMVVQSPALGPGRKSYIPAIPSPLNPSTSTTSINSISDETRSGQIGNPSPRDSSSSGEILSTPSTNTQGSKQDRKSKTSLSTPQQLLRQKSAGIAVQLDMQARQMQTFHAPKYLQDLGRDYSRYPISQSSLYSTPFESRSTLPLLTPRPSNISLPLTEKKSFGESSTSVGDLEKNYPDDRISAFEPYFGGEKGFILYNDEVEDDDDFHMPHDDDDKNFKPTWSEWLERRSLTSALGGVIMVLGLLCLFVVLPVLTYSVNIYRGGGGGDSIDYGPAWAHVNNNTYPLLKNVRTSLVDPDTPSNAMTRISTFDGSTLNLVFSDEFNNDGRTFYPGDDPFWTAPNIWYGATQDMEWYDPVAVTTGNGTLQLRMEAFPNHNLAYQSGMLNSWNQMCFKGGVMEVSLSLPGPSGVPGLWPGVWTMGNLGRPGFKATTEGVWPYTYNECDVGITPNQSSPDGLSMLPGQKLSSCTCKGQDHPNPGTGRGAPEIDVIEASVDPNNRIGVVTQSFQVAPFDIWYRPNTDFLQIPNYETTQMNTYCGGPFQQAISGTTLLNNDWYGGLAYQKYAFEYIPGTSDGKIAWFVGEDQTFLMDGRAIGQNGNIGARQTSEEPMSMVLNLGISGAWSQVLIGDLRFPTTMYVDYVRIYQKPGEESLTCDPPGYPTTQYIKDHPTAYMNPNLTAWNETGYDWPKNKLTGC